MKWQFKLLAFAVATVLQSCNTLYNTSLINLEIVEPAKVIFPPDFKNIAVRYNNSNVSYNPYFAQYSNGTKVLTDETNSDSLASEVYFNSFVSQLKNSILFDSITEISPADYSGVEFDVSSAPKKDSLLKLADSASLFAVPILAELHDKYTTPPDQPKYIVKLNSDYGLYSKENIHQIADSTDADLLLSLDYFSVYEECNYKSQVRQFCVEYVLVMWNFYDLRDEQLQYFYHRIDTVSWFRNANQYTVLPHRSDAILNASEIAGQNFSNFLVPHWVSVERTFYKSGHVELKQAEKLVDENRWLEAAKIWKKNTNNENKSIAAKSMFNLAVACEIEGNIDAALDWIVKSYHVFGEENEVHSFNCRDYLRILGQRKADFKKIDLQFNPPNAAL